MKKTKQNIKRFFALSGVFLLLLPITYQSYHELTVHHEHFICKAKNTHHLHQYHKKCPIEAFKYFSFTNSKAKQISQKISKFSTFIFSYYNFRFANNLLQNLKLRAPPYCLF